MKMTEEQLTELERFIVAIADRCSVNDYQPAHVARERERLREVFLPILASTEQIMSNRLNEDSAPASAKMLGENPACSTINGTEVKP